jgi:hypothetical protein
VNFHGLFSFACCVSAFCCNVFHLSIQDSVAMAKLRMDRQVIRLQLGNAGHLLASQQRLVRD